MAMKWKQLDVSLYLRIQIQQRKLWMGSRQGPCYQKSRKKKTRAIKLLISEMKKKAKPAMEGETMIRDMHKEMEKPYH